MFKQKSKILLLFFSFIVLFLLAGAGLVQAEEGNNSGCQVDADCSEGQICDIQTPNLTGTCVSSTSGSGSSASVETPLSTLQTAGGEIKVGKQNLPALVGNIISVILSLVGVILLIIVVYGGVLYMTAGGDSEKVRKAKSMIANSIIGLIIVLAAYSISSFVVRSIGGEGTSTLNMLSGSAGGLTGQNLPTLIGNILGVILSLAGVVLVIIITYAGFLWMTAGGDSEKVKKAKSWMTNAVIGLVIVLAAYAISNFVVNQIVSSTGAGNTGGGGGGTPPASDNGGGGSDDDETGGADNGGGPVNDDGNNGGDGTGGTDNGGGGGTSGDNTP
ncbi:MAG TPA: pilin, partial [Patescibacteria group bacterium]|nr:pilin [Patescibacteria group bacterium]